MILFQTNVEKITDIYDFLNLQEKMNDGEIYPKSVDAVLNILKSSVSKNDKRNFIIPLPIDSYGFVAILSPCVFNTLKDIVTLDYTISIVSLTQLNFTFRITGEMFLF